jgi:hypothetical protein
VNFPQILLVILAAVTVGTPGRALQQGGPATAAEPGPEGGLFHVGERLQYEVRWGLWTLGTAELTVVGIDTIRGTPSAHIRFHILGSNYMYRMDNRMDSWVALSDTTSRRFTQDFKENKKERHAWYDILPDSGYYREKGADSLAAPIKKSLEDVKRPLDDVAFFYFVRTMQLEPGKRYDIPQYFRPDRNPVTLDVKSKDTLDVPAGKFPSVVVQPIIKGQGILKEASDARMWLSDDDRHLMVQLKSKFPVVGYLTMRLIRVEGLPARATTPAQ